ncbi:hypothetical protein RSOLAG22IIIB_08077 [Rhizoctonia solani]|uniref:Uncharacterized protein n=1 Tax=Rhizoctonia solani TaxID=456999 RepID=A0A0K6FR47_9AGAM|nr:hypothetical protein RSOLAG22IIIB_08077 [Rhizoctonia solani]
MCAYNLRLVNLAEESEELDAPLVFTSTTVLPRYYEEWPENGPWCFYNDLKVVKSTLYKFDIAEDEEGKQSWIKRRREIVRAREQSSEPLREWFRKLEMEREARLERRRVAREAEIKTRLKKLGHDERDMDFCSSNLAFSLVHNASPLTDKAWKGLLPKLLKIIKANHEERIELQEINRAERYSDLYDWAWEICEPKMFHLCQESNRYYNDGPALNAMTLLLKDLGNRPEVISLLDENLSYDGFEDHFDSQTPKLTDLWIGWIDEQEARLVSMMPDDTSAPEFDRPGSESTMTFGTNYDTNIPMAALPLNTQKLLRADAVFVRTPTEQNSTGARTCYLYPDFDGLPEMFTYSNLASEIAATFLASLGRPNASHLEMTSAGANLECGMCPEIGTLGWKNFIEHCLNEELYFWLTTLLGEYALLAPHRGYSALWDKSIYQPNVPAPVPTFRRISASDPMPAWWDASWGLAWPPVPEVASARKRTASTISSPRNESADPAKPCLDEERRVRRRDEGKPTTADRASNTPEADSSRSTKPAPEVASQSSESDEQPILQLGVVMSREWNMVRDCGEIRQPESDRENPPKGKNVSS